MHAASRRRRDGVRRAPSRSDQDVPAAPGPRLTRDGLI